MTTTANESTQVAAESSTRGQELRAFLLLAVVLAPVLAIALVGALGFGIWILQMIVGPPGPPPA